VAHTELADTLNRFMVPDWVVITEEGRLVSVQSASFEEYDATRRRGALVLQPVISDTVSLACHPTAAEFAVLGSGGTLQRWDMVRHECGAARQFTKTAGARLAYARDGSFLVAGFQVGPTAHLMIPAS
jgi:hypothetical protein